VRDWIEALGWDTLSDASSSGAIVANAANCIMTMQEQPGGPQQLAETVNGVITWFPQAFYEDALRRDDPGCSYKHGFRLDEATMLTATTLHEARHCWQYSALSAQDGDSDGVPDSPELLDPPAARLKDEKHVSIVGSGGNPEAHFAGLNPNAPDPIGVATLSGVQHERDSYLFEQRATAGLSQPTAVYGSLVDAIFLNPIGGSLQIRGDGTRVIGAIKVRVRGDQGLCSGDENTTPALQHWTGGIQGVVVQLDVPQGAPLTFYSVGTALPDTNGLVVIAETDGDGIAQFDVAATSPGTYSTTITIRQLVPDLSGGGAILPQLPITITVTP